ncbi:MAG: tRNA (N(6)-L-threonylcarbamoyladenosine(37)-C(2))-methylthiotransferase MtaB [Desulfobacterales bacterium]
MMNQGVHIITLGCKVNQSESEALAACCRDQNGWKNHVSNGDAGLCIINTCAVTQKAEMQSRQAVRKAVRSHPDAAIVVTGCYAQRDLDAFAAMAGVDYVIGQAHKHRIAEIVHPEKHARTAAGTASCLRGPEIRHTDISGYRHFDPIPAPAVSARTRPFLKIQDGCDTFCSYCIVPYTRGRSRSLPPDQAVSTFRNLLETGAPEIVLSGIHIGKYGTDLNPQTNLCNLLKALDAIKGDHRIRLSSIEPTEITDELLGVIRDSARICPHFHVPLQSGDPRVLKKMKRPYEPELFSERVEKIRSLFPDAAIGADVLIGFPGEDDAAFEQTRSLIERLPLTYLHVFPYSPRPGTPAARFAGAVPQARIKERCRTMRALGLEKKRRFYQGMIGKTLDVVIEETRAQNNGFSKGLSENYIPVYPENAAGLQGMRIGCRITDAHTDQSLKGAAI